MAVEENHLVAGESSVVGRENLVVVRQSRVAARRSRAVVRRNLAMAVGEIENLVEETMVSQLAPSWVKESPQS